MGLCVHECKNFSIRNPGSFSIAQVFLFVSVMTFCLPGVSDGHKIRQENYSQ